MIVNTHQAYRIYRIIASFKGALYDTAFLVVRPVPQPNKLTLQTEKSFRIYYKMDIDTLLLTKTATQVYAVILDPFGNYIRYATNAVWSSSDTTSIVITPGDTLAGECILTANTANLKSAKIIVSDTIEGLVIRLPL